MRTLDEALQRAEVLRAFRDTNSERFDRNQDFADIVILADEVIRLRAKIERVGHLIEPLAGDPIHDLNSYNISRREDDHDESW